MLQPVAIDAVWDRFAPVAEAWMTDETQDGPEDMRKRCLDGSATCFESDNGIMVLFVRINGKTSERELVIWFAVSFVDCIGSAEADLPDVIACADSLRCARLVFFSPRLGWLRLALRLGFRIVNVEYAMELGRTFH